MDKSSGSESSRKFPQPLCIFFFFIELRNCIKVNAAAWCIYRLETVEAFCVDEFNEKIRKLFPFFFQYLFSRENELILISTQLFGPSFVLKLLFHKTF